MKGKFALSVVVLAVAVVSAVYLFTRPLLRHDDENVSVEARIIHVSRSEPEGGSNVFARLRIDAGRGNTGFANLECISLLVAGERSSVIGPVRPYWAPLRQVPFDTDSRIVRYVSWSVGRQVSMADISRARLDVADTFEAGPGERQSCWRWDLAGGPAS